MGKPSTFPGSAIYIKGGTAPEHYPDTKLPEFAFIGRSNAGKSTLINALTGRKALARTSTMPGRTQAIQFFQLDEHLVFADLPGYGYAQAPESVRKHFLPMVHRYLFSRKTLVGVVLAADIRRNPTPQEEALLDLIQGREVPLLLVLTKTDKVAKSKLKLRVREVADLYGLDPEHFFPYSGLTGAGRDALWEALCDLARERASERVREVAPGIAADMGGAADVPLRPGRRS